MNLIPIEPISFILPDSQFELMRQAASTTFCEMESKYLVCLGIELHRTRSFHCASLQLLTKSAPHKFLTRSLSRQFLETNSATDVVLRISTPLNTTTVDCKVANGKAKYIPAQNVMIWKYVSLYHLRGSQANSLHQDSPDTRWPGECTFMASAELMSTTNRQVWARPPIDVDFQVLMFTASGLIVSFLKVFERRNYHSIKWVRYFAKASGTSDSAKFLPHALLYSQS